MSDGELELPSDSVYHAEIAPVVSTSLITDSKRVNMLERVEIVRELVEAGVLKEDAKGFSEEFSSKLSSLIEDYKGKIGIPEPPFTRDNICTNICKNAGKLAWYATKHALDTYDISTRAKAFVLERLASRLIVISVSLDIFSRDLLYCGGGI